MSSDTMTVVTSTIDCAQIVDGLLQEEFIAADAEGINLSRDGPMTLLQVSTKDHQVYLFDVLTNKNLFSQGKLQKLLESGTVLKVMHSCYNDSAALHHQFNVNLNNVFDTQMAYLLLEEKDGVVFPKKVKLNEICTKYSEGNNIFGKKDEIKEKWLKDRSYWLKRPLTTEMKEYAAGDVISLLPDVYKNMNRCIEEKNLKKELEERVEEEIYSYIPLYRDRRSERTNRVVERVVKNALKKYSSATDIASIMDLDESEALRRISAEALACIANRLIPLRKQLILDKLKELEKEVQQEDVVKSHVEYIIKRYKNETDWQIKDTAEKLSKILHEKQLKFISETYSFLTKACHLSDLEKQNLRFMRPVSVSDPHYNTLVMNLHWKVLYDDLLKAFNRFKMERNQFKLKESYYKKIKYFLKGDVPATLKDLAKVALTEWDLYYGRNVVPEPSSYCK